MDIYIESKSDDTIGMWSEIQNKAIELGFSSPSELIRHLVKKGLSDLKERSKQGDFLVAPSLAKKMSKDLVIKATPKVIDIHLKNIPDKTKLQVSFFQKDSKGKSSYVSRRVVLMREDGKIVQRRTS